jgi:hypothetical protein
LNIKPLVLSLDLIDEQFVLKFDRWEVNKFVYVADFTDMVDLPNERINLVDFDMHFEDCNLDWRNTHVS